MYLNPPLLTFTTKSMQWKYPNIVFHYSRKKIEPKRTPPNMHFRLIYATDIDHHHAHLTLHVHIIDPKHCWPKITFENPCVCYLTHIHLNANHILFNFNSHAFSTD